MAETRLPGISCIPRASGGDPGALVMFDAADMYSPRKRGDPRYRLNISDCWRYSLRKRG